MKEKTLHTEGLISFIMRETRDEDEFRHYMRSISGYFPAVTVRLRNGSTYMSTYVRIQREGRWWKVFVMEAANPDWGLDASGFLTRFCTSVRQVQLFYKLTGQFEELDITQLSDEDLLRLQTDPKFKLCQGDEQ